MCIVVRLNGRCGNAVGFFFSKPWSDTTIANRTGGTTSSITLCSADSAEKMLEQGSCLIPDGVTSCTNLIYQPIRDVETQIFPICEQIFMFQM
jgi:hypothetical protein